MQPIKIVLTNANAIVRAGIKAMVNSQQDMKVVGEAATCEQAEDILKAKKPDIFLLDLDLPGCSPKEILQLIRSSGFDTKIIFLGGSTGKRYRNGLFRFGAGGYYQFDEPPEVLYWSIRSAYWGEIWPDLSLGAFKSLRRKSA